MRDQKPRGVPMDEWLLAIGLARDASRVRHRFDYTPRTTRAANSIGTDGDMGAGSDWSAAFNGAVAAVEPSHRFAKLHEGNRESFDAGYAFVIATESDS